MTSPPLLPDLEGYSADEIVKWAVEEYGDGVVLTASMADAVMIDLVQRAAPDVEVVFIDTGFHFRETLQTVERVRRRYPALRLTSVGPGASAEPIYRTGDLDACCAVNKVAPFEEALAGRSAWLTGLRRADAPTRADTSVVHWDERRAVVKVNPIIAWTDAEVDAYIAEHDVIVNPLLFDGYASIGCEPCTQRAEGRDGRWAGTAKTECGLHV
jgi:phosphoadenosine phosphosulfate reductase